MGTYMEFGALGTQEQVREALLSSRPCTGTVFRLSPHQSWLGDTCVPKPRQSLRSLLPIVRT